MKYTYQIYNNNFTDFVNNHYLQNKNKLYYKFFQQKLLKQYFYLILAHIIIHYSFLFIGKMNCFDIIESANLKILQKIVGPIRELNPVHMLPKHVSYR